MAHACPNCGTHDDCSHACPSCGAPGLVPLCHQPPDPMFICDACNQQFNADLSICKSEEGM